MNDVLTHFREAKALLDGHFVLSSGLHSPQYLQCALALRHPGDAAQFGQAMARHFTGQEIDTVASPAIGGIIIGFAVAQALSVPFIWTERENGVMTLRRGFSVADGEKILVVEDVITTGGSTRECIKALEDRGAQVVAGASIVDRSDGQADVGVPRVSLVTLAVPTYSADQCPLCERGIAITKPGSRQ